MLTPHHKEHLSGHAFSNLHGREREGLAVIDRRGMLKAGGAGMAGLSLPALLKARAESKRNQRAMGGNKAVIQ